jgi:septum formation topological specificity factor MinE
VRLAGVIANMRENQRQGHGIGQNRKTALEVAARYALSELACVHVHGTGGGAGGRLLLDTLCLPLPNSFPVHESNSRREAIPQELVTRR